MKKVFKRTISFNFVFLIVISTVVLTSLFIIAGAVASISPILDVSIVIKLGYLIMGIFMMYMVIILILDFFVPSFDYIIEVKEDIIYILAFKISAEPITVNKQFELIKHMNYLTLDDGNTTVDLYYNKELLDFLHQIQVKESWNSKPPNTSRFTASVRRFYIIFCT